MWWEVGGEEQKQELDFYGDRLYSWALGKASSPQRNVSMMKSHRRCKMWSKCRKISSPMCCPHSISARYCLTGVKDMVTILASCVQSLLGRSLRQSTCAYFHLRCMRLGVSQTLCQVLCWMVSLCFNEKLKAHSPHGDETQWPKPTAWNIINSHFRLYWIWNIFHEARINPGGRSIAWTLLIEFRGEEMNVYRPVIRSAYGHALLHWNWPNDYSQQNVA